MTGLEEEEDVLRALSQELPTHLFFPVANFSSKYRLIRVHKVIPVQKEAKRAFEEGVWLNATGKEKEAEERFRTALQFTPSLFPALFYLGESSLKEGERNRAISLFQKVLAIAPECQQAREKLKSLMEQT